MAMYGTRSVVLVLLLVLAGCASSAAGSGSQRNSDVLTQEEMQEKHHTNAFDAIQSLRPVWLRDRGPQSLTLSTAGQLVVLLDGINVGGVSALRQIRVTEVQTLRYYSASNASSRFGAQANGGPVIFVESSTRL
jgi:outer membrane lipoprotein SlyB